jgi:hypothetical protein
MREASEPSTEEVEPQQGVPAPPGVVMVAPPTLLRKAEGAQSEGRAKEIVKERDQEPYKGRSP